MGEATAVQAAPSVPEAGVAAWSCLGRMCSPVSSLVQGPVSTVVRAAGLSISQAGIRMCWELGLETCPALPAEIELWMCS